MSISKQLDETFMLEEVGQTIILDSSQLVREIKNYPIIYDNNSRRDQTSIFLAWESICTKLIPNFPSMKKNEKIAARKRLRDRWSYMRSTFRRDLVNDNMYCHYHLDWIQEITFLVPILNRTTGTSNSTKNARRQAKYKSYINQKKRIPHKTTSTITTTTATSASNSIDNSLQSSSSNSIATVTIENSETIAANVTTESSISDIEITCDSSSSEKSSSTSSLDLILSNPMETAEDEKSKNDLMIQTFMSTLNSDSILASIVDPDQLFLLTLLQNYRMVRSENKEALQHKFYTFLRD